MPAYAARASPSQWRTGRSLRRMGRRDAGGGRRGEATQCSSLSGPTALTRTGSSDRDAPPRGACPTTGEALPPPPLIEHVAERSLVLIDEPESHLHPPLLASFIQTLSRLLTERNGVAVVATHSPPVVLQEVPRSCVYKLSGGGPAGGATQCPDLWGVRAC
ncbi:AAA family ATPase [Streptomyces sp. NPDC059851]|uniref:AAA family ATPase n=1 Tax=Streptomyces sp. NPDC059851 TaxID=3346971 RepID=UPI003652E784